MLHLNCTRLRPGHLSVRVGDSSQRSDCKKSRIAPWNAIIVVVVITIIINIIMKGKTVALLIAPEILTLAYVWSFIYRFLFQIWRDDCHN